MTDAISREDALAKISEIMVARYGVDFVEDLLSDDPETAAHEAAEFCDALYHQGDIPAEADTFVPYLVATLEHVGPRVQEELIYALDAMATALNAPGGDRDLIRRTAVAVHRHRDAIARFLTDPDEGVRTAALIALTDLTRINLPGMPLPDPPPAFVGALPEGADPEALRRDLETAIEAGSDRFDDAWRRNCLIARGRLAFEPDPEGVHGPGARSWSALDRFAGETHFLS